MDRSEFLEEMRQPGRSDSTDRWVIWEDRVREREVYRMTENGKFCRLFHEMGPMLLLGFSFFETQAEAQHALAIKLEAEIVYAQHRLQELDEEVERELEDDCD
jgi:hypothetical protein